MRFAELVEGLPGLVRTSGDTEISSVAIDSRKVQKGALFIALPGAHTDGHEFLESAVSNGGAGFAVTSASAFDSLAMAGRCVAQFEDNVAACWRLSKRFYGDPSHGLRVVGVTGTNGKTTTAWLLWQMLQDVGTPSAYIGTLGAKIGNETVEMGLTTPFPPEIFSILARARANGIRAVVMEVSSHALSQHRVDGVEFDVGIFTNLSQDHLDFHADLDDYFTAKARLFSDLPNTKKIVPVVNVGDPFGARLFKALQQGISFGDVPEADIRPLDVVVSVDRIKFNFIWKSGTFQATSLLGAHFNVENCCSAIAAMLALGYTAEEAVHSLRGAKPAPGRFESVPTGSDYTVIVDYAHTPDALSKLLSSVRKVCDGRIIAVFGCGGDRDRTKRPKMAAAVTAVADFTYVTSDNPRTEDPLVIIEDILPGIVKGANYRVEADRRKAIHSAIAEARNGDVVAIAGKGHEDYQIVGTTKHRFDDREVALEAVREKAACV